MAMMGIAARAARGPALRVSGTKRWVVTIAATAVSTYALDAAATVAGLLLVASHLLRGVDHATVLLLLASTYVLWGTGLRVNLAANWALLEKTGTSTNALSKAAYDLAKLRTGSVRVRRVASAVGYVGTEAAKETPYYAGAVGAALLSDGVSSRDALVFLGGANLGAAAYEYGLARLIGAFLHRRDAPVYASFETDWVPGDYLRDYYSTVEPDERRTIAFFVDAMRHSEPDEPVLFFGVGPTLHHVFLAAGTASELHLGDYLPANLHEIERWIARDAAAHDWRPFVRYTLECESSTAPTEDEITAREDVTRAKLTKLLEVDIRRTDPLGEGHARPYGTVISAYCADSATADRGTWEAYMRRIAGLVGPGGTLILAALHRSRGYLVGDKTFPSANVGEADLRAALAPYFRRKDLAIEVCDLPAAGAKGYSSIILARAHRRRVAVR